ncbi:Fur-regulated basic protein FbpA [Fictibacillus phosphorivorans]|uniref:Fur-regulated basic protein FbpA n=1 Tax=Fictibacillus phosphorivorans TaxID=1221500 RepID=UPI00203A8E40|nr:Fur-regulated basic protein FbpA [Fictibacillus phosphorivorans]MCM3718033.1 Fur-regulated basic protein FbpA [Fictibacillus phosphorivorans]MCM3775482.1 Fur-regulated basic protein FbpA [Fictibacillus phosphorivorans]
MNQNKGHLRRAVEGRKQRLIQHLIHKGLYGYEDHRHLTEFTLTELETEWKNAQLLRNEDHIS